MQAAGNVAAFGRSRAGMMGAKGGIKAQDLHSVGGCWRSLQPMMWRGSSGLADQVVVDIQLRIALRFTP